MIAEALSGEPTAMMPLHGGCVATVYQVKTDDGRVLAAKVDDGPAPALETEAFMLEFLRARSVLPIPAVVFSSARVLMMEYMEHGGGPCEAGRRAFADAMADLHGVTGGAFGLGRDTLIGPLTLPNDEASDWAAFYAEHRVRHFVGQALSAGRIGRELADRCERATERMAGWLASDEPPTLLHGDLWSGNVLWRGGRVAGVIDPAVYFGHREVELAFMDLFGSFGDAFWDRYQERRPIRAGFWERRRHVYRLYPLLVHVTLFGGSYRTALSAELDALGVP